jgi:hypothetical protein
MCRRGRGSRRQPSSSLNEKETKETMQPLIVGRDITGVGAFT